LVEKNDKIFRKYNVYFKNSLFMSQIQKILLNPNNALEEKKERTHPLIPSQEGTFRRFPLLRGD
jgi:hypothetical protein